MAILIDMEMPNYCYECPFHSKIYNGIESQWWCSLLNKIAHDDEGHKTKECPIVEVTEVQDAVSRQAAKLKVARVIWEDGDSCYDFHDKCVDCLDDVPSAQPEIIMCKDCKNWDTSWKCSYGPKYHYCVMVDKNTKSTFYCGDAERKTDECN